MLFYSIKVEATCSKNRHPLNHILRNLNMKKQLLYISAVVISQSLNCFFAANASAQKITGGVYHSLAICSDGTVMGWGDNAYGELGNGINGTVEHHPVEVSGLTGISAIGGGVNFTVSLKNDGTAWTWGSNADGELGNGSAAGFSNVPVQVSLLSDITSVARGMQNAVALRNDGTVWDWGYNNYGQLGTGSIGSFSNIPVQVSGLTGVIAIAGGAYHSLALRNDGTVWSWGYNGSGELGNGNNTNSTIPVQVSGLTGITAVACGNSFSLALRNDSTVWAWGGNLEGELGNGANTGSFLPVQVSGLTKVIAIAGGVHHSLALRKDGTVWTWGFNMYGQLGNGTNTDSNIPIQVSTLSGIVGVAAGYGHSLAMKNDGTVWDWGYNNFGQLGNGNNTDSNIPLEVSGLCQVTTAIAELPELAGISAFPNPLENELTISGTKVSGTAILFDISGKELKRQHTLNGESKVNTSTLMPGVYVLTYREADKSVNIKLIKY
jgi:alpha-tubulin suppressor-like RCC1 family protein